jgi:gamma-glutamylcyclotransferase (GGCT)/AIG2-like uncharacterized protein YtfP
MYRYSSFPALVESESGTSILGELYEVSDSCIMELDEVEGTRHNLFNRKLISLDKINFLLLPLEKSSSDFLMNNNAFAYFFADKTKLLGLKCLGANWTL